MARAGDPGWSQSPQRPASPVCSGVAVVEYRQRRFVAVHCHAAPSGKASIIAVCEEGRAWRLIVEPDNAIYNWTELLPLPRIEIEVAEQPAAELSPTAEVINNLVQRIGDGSLTLATALEEFRDHWTVSESATPPAPAGGLVERVADAIVEATTITDREAACAAIREIAAALRNPATPVRDVPSVANWLDREANRLPQDGKVQP